MKAHLNRKELLAALDVAIAVAPRRGPKPILSCVKIEAVDGLVTISATNLDQSVSVKLHKVDVTEPGELMVHPTRFKEFAKSSQSDVLLLETLHQEPVWLLKSKEPVKDDDGEDTEEYLYWRNYTEPDDGLPVGWVDKDSATRFPNIDSPCCDGGEYEQIVYARDYVSLKDGVGRCELESDYQVKDYPALTFHTGPYCWQRSEDFCSMLAQVESATDNESIRYALGGVKIELSGGLLTMIGTDGRRLHHAVRAANEVAAEDGSALSLPTNCIIPLAAVKVLRKIGKAAAVIAMIAEPVVDVEHTDKDGEVTTRTTGGNAVTFYAGDATLTTRLLEGRFPRWRDVFPSEGNTQPISIDATKLRDAIKKVLPAVSEDSRGVDFDWRDGILTIKAGNGKAVTSFNGFDATLKCGISLDPRFVLDVLAPCSKREILTLRLNCEKPADCPAWFQRDGYGAVVMPMAR